MSQNSDMKSRYFWWGQTEDFWQWYVMVLLVPCGLHVKKLSWNLVRNRRNRHKSILWLKDISCVTYRHLRNLVQGPIFPLSQYEQMFCFASEVCFFMHKYVHLERKNCMVCIFAVILIFLFAFRSCGSKMSVSHKNKIWKYITNLILFQVTDFCDSHNAAKVYPSTRNIRQVSLKHAPGNPKRFAKVSVSHKMFALLYYSCQNLVSCRVLYQFSCLFEWVKCHQNMDNSQHFGFINCLKQ